LKKTTKLLSVLLAVVMMMSCFTMASYAAIADVKTGESLNGLSAYSPDGAVTRLSTDERMSLVLDWLDLVLYDVNFAGIDVKKNYFIVNIDLHVHINSVDQILQSVDSVKSNLEGNSAFAGMLGDLGDLKFTKWQKNMSRKGTLQLNIVNELCELLLENAGVLENVLAKGELDAGGIVNGMLPRAKLNKILGNIPGLILSKLYPLMSRKDDAKATADDYFNGNGTPSTVLNNFVNGLFSKAQSTTTYKEDAAGNCISGHTLPTQSQGLRYYYVKTGSGDGAYFTAYVWDTEKQDYVAEEATFKRSEESTGVYTYKTDAGDGLKYYKTGSYWLPSLQAELAAGTKTINVNTESAATLLYKFAPYVFADLAPIAVNGFLKKTLAEWMGATFTKFYEGKAGTAEAAEALATVPASVQSLFTDAVPYYQFSYSNYAVLDDDTHYYRYVDKDTNTEEWFVGDMTTGNEYLSLFNFNYHVDGDFLDEFIPTSYNSSWTILQNLNDFAIKVAQTALKPEEFAKLNLQSGNENFVANIRNAAQVFLPLQPDAILGPDYLVHYDGYYQNLISTTATDDEVFASLAAIIAKALMPQLILPSADKLAGQKVGAVLACIVRELVTQFVPTYNYDALIFTDYNTRTLVTGKDNNYWLDVILTMGVDVGMSYLKELTDLGENATGGYTWAASKTYTADSFDQDGWEDTVDWIIDWALTVPSATSGNSINYEWCWAFANLIDTTGLTVALGSAQDPWQKLDKILNDLLPLKQIINCTAADGKTWLETVLRDKLILGIADMNFGYIFGSGSKDAPVAGLLSIPSNSILRTKGAVPAIFQVVRDLLNKVVYKVAGNVNLFDTAVFTGIDTLVAKSTFKPAKTSYSNCPNIVRPISVLLRNLKTAYDNGLLTAVLPILNMFVGWKTGSQEIADPGITWGGDYVKRTKSVNDGISLSFTNKSAGMLLKNYRADGSFDYEKAYNMVIDNISASGLSFTLNSGYTTTVAPYGRAIYTVKASSVPSADTATRIEIKYHYQGKDGSSIGGTQYAYTYMCYSPNDNLVTYWSSDEALSKKHGGLFGLGETTDVKTAVGHNYNILARSMDDLEKFEESAKLSFSNNAEYDAKFTTLTYKPSQAAWIKLNTGLSSHANTVLKKGDSVEFAYCQLAKDPDQYVTGTSYSAGSLDVVLTRTDENYSTDKTNFNIGKLYYANMPDLEKLYNDEASANRKASDYTDSGKFTAYLNAMNAATILMRAPITETTFASRYSQQNINTVTTNLENAVADLNDCKADAISYKQQLENGVTAGEAGAAIGADGQINFQDYELYGYWKYEDNRTKARDMAKEYEEPTAPQQYIDGCWLPYEDTVKHEDLSTVIANEANTTKKAAIQATLQSPSDAAMEAYNIAHNEFKMPEYSALVVADTVSKLGYYNQFLIPRAYSKNATGRAQLAQEIAYAQAQNYNEADYTAKSWARYQDALTAAQAINDDSMQSYVFQAKYDLLKAQRDLRLAAYDWETQNGYDELQRLVDLAEGMFANSDYFTAVDGTLDKEWTNLLVALGYEANFGSGNDAWSMNLYGDSATQLMSEELDTRSGRNEARVEEVTAALQAAIDALKCTIEVIKNDDTTVVDQEIKYITNIAPLALTGVNAVLTHVKASSNAATLTVTATANGFGTGTTVAATLNGIPLANYFIVIYGDVNGDNAIDGFDASKADAKLTSGASFTAPQEKAADATKDGSFDVADVSAIISAGAGNTEISQA